VAKKAPGRKRFADVSTLSLVAHPVGLVKLGGVKISKSLGKRLDNGIKIVFPKWIFSLDEPGSTIEHGVERNSIGVGFIGEGIR